VTCRFWNSSWVRPRKDSECILDPFSGQWLFRASPDTIPLLDQVSMKYWGFQVHNEFDMAAV
jgi:hypothetical protein